ncbi:unnamed protein product, partial [marine sediment metagenome]
GSRPSEAVLHAASPTDRTASKSHILPKAPQSRQLRGLLVTKLSLRLISAPL